MKLTAFLNRLTHIENVLSQPAVRIKASAGAGISASGCQSSMVAVPSTSVCRLISICRTRIGTSGDATEAACKPVIGIARAVGDSKRAEAGDSENGSCGAIRLK